VKRWPAATRWGCRGSLDLKFGAGLGCGASQPHFENSAGKKKKANLSYFIKFEKIW
jgi:hypothetical protein